MDDHRKTKKQLITELAQRIAVLSITILILFSAVPTPVPAQSGDDPLPPQTDAAPNLKFEHLTDEDFVIPNFIFDILQDHNGFMWFASSDGLYKYDGYDLTVYTAEPGNPESLSDVYISAIHEDQQGNLWIGTNAGGVNRLDLSTDIITRFEHDENDPTSLSDNRIPFKAIYEDNSGAIWIGTDAGGLNRFDPATESFIHYQHDPDNSNTLSSNRVLAIAAGVSKEGDEVLWVGTDAGLNRFDPGTESFVHYTHDPANANSLANDTIYEVYQSPDSNLVWIGTKNGLDLFDPLTETFTHYQHDDNNPHSLSHNIISGIMPAEDNQLWIITQGGGLNKFDPATETFVHYQNDPDDPYSLNSNSLSMLYQDQAGTLWIGSHGSGINKYDPIAQKFRLYQYDSHDPTSIIDTDVVSIYIDRAGIAWLGSPAGLNRFDPETEIFTNFQHDPGDPTSLNQNHVHDVCEDKQGVLWIGTWGGGLSIFDRATETFTPFRLEGMTVNRSNHIFEDSQERLWVGTFNGLYRLDPKRETFHYFKSEPKNPNSLSNPIVHRIYEDSKGTIWVTTNGGLNKFVPESEQFIRYLPDKNDPHSLSNESVKRVEEDAQGILWFTTNIGLDKFDPETEQFTTYFEKDGLPNNRVNSIVMDDDGIFWLGTGDGLSRFDPNTETFRNYYEGDGLQGNRFGLAAATKDEQGNLYFGGNGGLNVFHPSEIRDNPNIPPVVLTGFQIFNEDVPIGPDSALHEQINDAEEIVLTYDQRVFSFEFAGLSFTAPEQNRYAYKMEGFDDDWRTTGAGRRFATYTNLDPGNYTFRVKASNNDGVWNEEGTSIRLTMTPAWWQTWWFRALAVASVLAVFGYVYLTKVNQLESEKVAAAAVRESEEKYRVLFEAFPLGITVSDDNGNILETNAIAETLLAVPKPEHEQRGIDGQEWRIVRPDGSSMPPEEYAGVIALQENRRVDNVEMGIVNPDETITWLNVTAAPIPLENHGVVISYNDVTARKQAEEQLKLALADKETLLQELYHRTKNNMMVIMSLINLQADQSQDETVRMVLQEIRNRVRSMALVHQKLYQSQNLSSIDLSEYIRELTALLMASYQIAPERVSLVLDLEPALVLIDTAVPCGLIINELVSNVFKHAFPHNEPGELRITLKHSTGNKILLQVADDGVGLPSGFDPRKSNGMGLKILFSITEYQLQGQVSYESRQGVTWQLEFRDTLYQPRV